MSVWTQPADTAFWSEVEPFFARKSCFFSLERVALFDRIVSA